MARKKRFVMARVRMVRTVEFYVGEGEHPNLADPVTAAPFLTAEIANRCTGGPVMEESGADVAWMKAITDRLKAEYRTCP